MANLGFGGELVEHGNIVSGDTDSYGPHLGR
jgi:hypothetical protein